MLTIPFLKGQILSLEKQVHEAHCELEQRKGALVMTRKYLDYCEKLAESKTDADLPTLTGPQE